MFKRAYPEKVSMTNRGWASLDSADLDLVASVYKKSMRSGEEQLMLAVLENAVECFQSNVFATRPSRKQLFREAEEWFLDTDNEALYSFENICETLGFHPDHIRKGLIAWKEAKLKLGSVDAQAVRPKVSRSRVKHPSIRVSKTA
jgi:hypothetical protein